MELRDGSALIDWLVDGARSAAQPQEVLAELCDGLAAGGMPLWRVAVLVRTLHPEMMGRRFVWQPGQPVEVRNAPYMMDTQEYRDSPVTQVLASRAPLRRKLCDPACPMDSQLVRDLRDQGATDYVATPLIFTNGDIHLASWTTKAPGGFTDAQVSTLLAIAAPFARVAEVRALRRTAENFLNTYVGRHAGERILAGQIRRGHSESIEAVVWLSDMRGFTSLADRVAPEALIEQLNRYFDCQVPHIQEKGGEVLKFMGDGLLAIFALPEGTDGPKRACASALEAALAARAAVAAMPDIVGQGKRAGPRFGLALHLGRVLYGNIGSGARLDFTCIGPAVNLAARIEKLTGKLGRAVLLSAEFARASGAALVPVGQFELAGFQEPQTVYGLADEETKA